MKVTIGDIAKMANVSKATVSRVINNKPEGVGKETRNKILKLVEELKFQPSMIARGLVTKKTKSIGLIIPDITNPFFPQLVRGAEDYANAHGYHIFLCNSDKSIKKEEDYLNAFVEKSVDGVIITSNISMTSDSQYKSLKESNIPCVLLDRYVEDKNFEAGVFLDNIKGAYLATDFLLKQGHRGIVFITGPLSVTTSVNRLKGFEMAFKENRLQVNSDLIREGDYLIDSGYTLTEKLIEEGKKFTAIFAGNDMMAIGAIKALRRRNIKIPEEVEIIGYDNIEISQIIEPALSTVAQPAYEMGTQGAKILIKLIEGKKLRTKNIYLDPELILRGTTKGK